MLQGFLFYSILFHSGEFQFDIFFLADFIVVYYIFLNLLENITRVRYLSNNIYTSTIKVNLQNNHFHCKTLFSMCNVNVKKTSTLSTLIAVTQPIILTFIAVNLL